MITEAKVWYHFPENENGLRMASEERVDGVETVSIWVRNQSGSPVGGFVAFPLEVEGQVIALCEMVNQAVVAGYEERSQEVKDALEGLLEGTQT